MRDLDVQVRYAMTWDDKVAPMSVNILREFMRSLCSAEEHLPKSFSRVRFVIYTNNLSHDRVATWLHRVPSNGSSSDARRLLNIDRLPFPRRAFGDFTSWLERRDKSRKPGQQPRRNWFGPLRVDDYASVRRLLVDLYTSEPSSAYLYIGADTVFVRPPALLAANASCSSARKSREQCESHVRAYASSGVARVAATPPRSSSGSAPAMQRALQEALQRSLSERDFNIGLIDLLILHGAKASECELVKLPEPIHVTCTCMCMCMCSYT